MEKFIYNCMRLYRSHPLGSKSFPVYFSPSFKTPCDAPPFKKHAYLWRGIFYDAAS